MSNLAKYGSYDMATAEKEEADNSRSGAEFMRLEVGRNVVRILPPKLGKSSPFRVVWTHYVTPLGATSPEVFTCPYKEAKKPCPVCQAADKLSKTGNPKDLDKAKGMFARRKVYCAVINMEAPDEGVRVLGFGKGIHDDLIALRKNPDWGDFCHPEMGFDIVIERKGTTMTDTEYKTSPRPRAPLGNLEWLNNLPDLDAIAKVLSVEEILAKTRGEEGAKGTAVAAAAPPAGRVVDATFDAAADGKIPF